MVDAYHIHSQRAAFVRGEPYAGSRVVSAVGTRPPYYGSSQVRSSFVSGAVSVELQPSWRNGLTHVHGRDASSRQMMTR